MSAWLSLVTPTAWGNGYSVVQSFLSSPPALLFVGGVLLCKLLAVMASSGSGAPGGVFTPTLFMGAALGMLFGQVCGLWGGGEPLMILLGLTGMASLLAATTHAPIMATLMICEMTGEFTLLPGLAADVRDCLHAFALATPAVGLPSERCAAGLGRYRLPARAVRPEADTAVHRPAAPAVFCSTRR